MTNEKVLKQLDVIKFTFAFAFTHLLVKTSLESAVSNVVSE